MKIFGSLSELISIIYRKNSQTITVRPNQTTTYTAARDVQLPPQDANAIIVSETATQTLTNKTLTSPAISSPTGITKSDVGLGNVDNTSNATERAATATLTGKTMDGDNNTFQDIGIASLKAVVGDASKVLTRNGTGDVVSTLIDDTNVAAAANITATKLATGAVSNTQFNKLSTAGTAGAGNLATTDGTQTLTSKTIAAGSNTITGLTKSDVGLANVDNTSDATKNAATVVLTNKDIDGGTASNTSRTTLPSASTATLAALTRKAGAVAYDTTTTKVVFDNGSAFAAIGGSGSGAGELNAVLNASASDALTGWTDGTSHTTTRITSGSPLDPVITTALNTSATTTAVESSTSGAKYSITTMPASLTNKKLKVELYFTTEASQTWAVSVYAGATRIALSTDSSGATLLPAGTTGKFVAYFDTTNATAYSVNLTRTAGAGTAVLKFTNVIVGPGIQPQGAVVSAPSAWTPTFTGFGTATNINMSYSRVGSRLVAKGNFKAGTTSAVLAKLSLPIGLTINSAYHVSDRTVLGRLIMTANAANADFTASSGEIAVIYNSADNSVVYFAQGTDASGSNNVMVPANGNGIFNGNSNNAISFDVEIAEWSGSGTLNTAQNDVEYAYNTSTVAGSDDLTSFAQGPSGVLTGAISNNITRRVQFTSPILVTDKVVVEASFDRVKWFQVDCWTYNNTSAIEPLNLENVQYAGVGLSYINSTAVNQADIFFGSKAAHTGGNAYGAASFAWPASGLYWRVKKEAAGAAVGFGLANATTTGLVSREIAPIEGALPTLTWGGAVAPSGTITQKYKWTQVGKVVTVEWRIEASVAGTANTLVSCALPSDMPSPANHTNQSVSEWVTVSGGAVLATGAAALNLGGAAGLYKEAGGTYGLYIYSGTATVSATFAAASLSYVVD